MDPHTQRAEAERWLGIAAKLLTARDFLGSKTFAIRAREADPNNNVSDQILAVVDTVLAGEKRVNSNQQPDWYAVLQLPRLVRDPDLIADHYRRLVLCLERNRFPFADYALQMVMDAWSVLSDPNKKWLFDNELALYLQQGEPVVQPAAAAGAAGGPTTEGSQLNTFQFFQPQPQPLPPPPPQQQHQHQHQQPMWQHQHQQINQREFMPLPIQSQQQQHQHQHQQHEQVPPQWQMRDPTPSKEGERHKGVINGIGIGARVAVTTSPMIPTQTTSRPVPQGPPTRQPSPPLPAVTVARVSPTLPPVSAGRVSFPMPPVMVAREPVIAAAPVVDGNAGNVPTTNATDNNSNNAAANENNNCNLNGVDTNAAAANEDNDEEEVEEDVVEDIESFWTACPYCFYIYEYSKVYRECTLRCQNCRKGFHAVQIPNPPPISSAINDGGGGKEKKVNSFCCWGFFPLGFSMTAWKKQNQFGNNGSTNWMPFSTMFTCPIESGGGGFQWFDSSDGNAYVGPNNVPVKRTPWVYKDDDDTFIDLSDPSDLDSSDGDWRTYNQEKSKKKKRGKIGGRKRGRPRKEDVLNQVNQNVASGGGVSVGGEKLDDGPDGKEVVMGLAAGEKSDTGKTITSPLTRKQTRRSKKDVGRLDLNVEFNNDGEEHAPTVSALNGEEDGIENIEFFEGLDEFLSTLPILNVDGDEKAKPS